MAQVPNKPDSAAVTPTEAEDDATLARRAGDGQAAAFGILYDRYVDAVYRYVFYRVRNEAEAEDVTSDVFMRALKAIPRYEPRQAFLAWLYRIARNAVIDRARRARTQVSFEDALAHPNADRVIDPHEALFAEADVATLRGAMSRLTDLQQEVIVLRYVEGLETAEIARMLGKRDGTVRGIQFRALGALREMLPSRKALS